MSNGPLHIVYISSWFPYPADNGSRIRAFSILKTLAAKHKVTLLSFTDPDFLPEHADALRAFCQDVHTTPRLSFRPDGGRALAAFLSPDPRFIVDTYSVEMQRLVQEALNRERTDLIYAGELTATLYVQSEMPPAKVFDDLETGIFYDAYANAQGTTRWRRALTWWKMAQYLRRRSKVFDALTVVSTRERELAREIGVDDARLFALPNGIDSTANALIPKNKTENSLIYSGALTYDANRDAMNFFVHEILPLVKSHVPQVRLTITGRADQVAINELSVDNAILFTGYVTDVHPLVAASQVCIVPLRLGGGTRLKILEAMALGTPVVSTTKGIEGLDLIAGEHVLIGDTPEEFARQVVALLNDTNLSQQLSIRARKLVAERYDWKIIANQLDQLIKVVMQRKRNGYGRTRLEPSGD